ncbi:MAG: BON domain-containing protein [Casimicrobiaceae bacterium]
MKLALATTCFVLGAALAPVAIAADSDTDRNKPATFVKDSMITTKIKAKLAAENPASMANISVDTDKDGVVWMSGSAKTQAEVEKAMSIARGTEGVKTVKGDVKVQK